MRNKGIFGLIISDIMRFEFFFRENVRDVGDIDWV